MSAYSGDGSNRWPAVHRSDAAALVRQALEAPAGTIVHAVAEEGVPARDIATAIGQGLGLPVTTATPDHFGWLGPFFAADIPASSTVTQKQLGWTPTHPTLLEDLAAGHYFTAR
ncbi:Rossmann-fold NAD(P)-binding domain-containing protein [Dactylosporangium cerinum]